MIRNTKLRNNGELHNFGTHEVSAQKALETLVVWELGYSGFVTDISPTKVVVETHIFSCKDTTILEGSEEEMQLIVRVAVYHSLLMSNEKNRSTLIDRTADFLGTLPKEIGGLPLYISIVAPMLIGGSSASIALLLAVGITDLETVKILRAIQLKDLVAAVQLHYETGIPLTEIAREMELVAA